MGIIIEDLQQFKNNLTLAHQQKFAWPLIIIIIWARTPEIGQGLEHILSCGARKPEET